MSFIKKEDSESSSLWDWGILIGLVVAGGGFWFYYQHQKTSTLEGFKKADSLYILKSNMICIMENIQKLTLKNTILLGYLL